MVYYWSYLTNRDSRRCSQIVQPSTSRVNRQPDTPNQLNNDEVISTPATPLQSLRTETDHETPHQTQAGQIVHEFIPVDVVK